MSDVQPKVVALIEAARVGLRPTADDQERVLRLLGRDVPEDALQGHPSEQDESGHARLASRLGGGASSPSSALPT